MTTAGGLIIGAVGLGSVYSTCVGCYCVFHKMRAFDRDSEYLASKLETEGALLMRWGERVGLLSEHRLDVDPQLHDPWTKKAVAGVLFCIEMLFTDTEKLQTTYGLIPYECSSGTTRAKASSRQNGNRSSETQTRLSEMIGLERKSVNILRKYHWSIIDKEKFNDLISELRDLVQRLNELAPPKRGGSDRRVGDEDVLGLSRSGSCSERGDPGQREHRRGTSHIPDDTRNQDKSLAIITSLYRPSYRALAVPLEGHDEEIAQPENVQARRDYNDGSYRIYRYYRLT